METKIEIGSCRGEVMKRSELESFIMETYNAEADYPWLKYPNYEATASKTHKNADNSSLYG